MLSRKSLILFDLDGVIVDSRSNMEHAWAEVQNQLNVTVDFPSYFALIGRPFADIIAELGLSHQLKEIEQVFRITSATHLDLATFYPSAVATLVKLHQDGIKLGIVTSKDRLRSSAILARLPVEFVTIQTPDPRYRGKPAPDHLLVAMAEVHVDPAETVYIGDMDADYEAASRARIDYVHAAWGYGQSVPESTVVAHEFSQVAELLGDSTN